MTDQDDVMVAELKFSIVHNQFCHLVATLKPTSDTLCVKITQLYTAQPDTLKASIMCRL